MGTERKKPSPLTPKDVADVMSEDILIASAERGVYGAKTFCYNPQKGEFVIYKDAKYFSGGMDMEALIEEYNSL